MTNSTKKPFPIIYIQLLILLPLLAWTSYFVLSSTYSVAVPTAKPIQTPYTKPDNKRIDGSLTYKSLTGKQIAKKPDSDISDPLPNESELKTRKVVASKIDVERDEHPKKQKERTDELKKDQEEVQSIKPKLPESHEKNVADSRLNEDLKGEERDAKPKAPEKQVRTPEPKEAQIQLPKSNHGKEKRTEDSLKKTPVVPDKGKNEDELKLDTPKSVPEARPVEKRVEREDKSSERDLEQKKVIEGKKGEPTLPREEDGQEEEPVEDDDEEDEDEGGERRRRGRNTFKKN